MIHRDNIVRQKLACRQRGCCVVCYLPVQVEEEPEGGMATALPTSSLETPSIHSSLKSLGALEVEDKRKLEPCALERSKVHRLLCAPVPSPKNSAGGSFQNTILDNFVFTKEYHRMQSTCIDFGTHLKINCRLLESPSSHPQDNTIDPIPFANLGVSSSSSLMLALNWTVLINVDWSLVVTNDEYSMSIDG